MDSLADHLKVKSLQNHSIEVDDIRRSARHWRLMDCSVETLEQMRHAVIEEIEKIEAVLHAENRQFIQFIENARPIETESSRETIERLSSSWEELNSHLKEIDDAILDSQLRRRLIKFFRGRMGYYVYEALVFIAILIVITIVIIEFTIPITNETLTQLLLIDTGLSIFLLIDFFFRMLLSIDKGWYFKRYWVDFIASLPISVLHFGRLLRITRFLRLLRILRLGSTIRIVSHIFRGLDKLTKTFELNLLKRSLIIATVLLLFGAFSISALESPFNSNFLEWRESFWWSFTTVVTGGFADLYNPETVFGRVITMTLILVGFVVTSVFTASLTSVLIEDDSSRIERSQHALNSEISSIQQKLDLLSGETNQGLIALEQVAQMLSNQSSTEDLGAVLVEAMLTHFETLHASVHLLDVNTAVVKTIFQKGDERVRYPAQEQLNGDILGQTLSALVELENPAYLDIEPITEPFFELAAVRMLCPMVANNQVIGALQVVMPEEHGRFYLYNRAPQTLAHHAAVAFHLLQLKGAA